MLNKQDLTEIGISPGPIFADIFKATKSCKTRDEALAIAISIKEGTFEKPQKRNSVINPDSVLHWLLDFKWCPSINGSFPASMSDRRRILEQGALTIDGRKPVIDDIMPLEPWEVTFFKGSKRQISIFFDNELAPIGTSWQRAVHTGKKDEEGHEIVDFVWSHKV